MTKDLEENLEFLQKQHKEKHDALYKLNRSDNHIRYSGEMNSSIFEMLAEIGILVSHAYKNYNLQRSIKKIQKTIDEKVPLVNEIEAEVSRIKKAYVEKFNLHEVEEDLNRDIEQFIQIRMLYDKLDALSLSSPQYQKVIDNFQLRMLDPHLSGEEILQKSVIEVDKMDTSIDKKVVLNLFEALVGEVFKEANPLAEERMRPQNGENRMDTIEETHLHRVVQRQRR
jgi:hypothetical protein